MSEQERKQTSSQYTAEQYLMTAFSRAEWISPEYKQLSITCKDNPLAFRELYLCACDRVSVEAVQIALSNEPVVDNLKIIRKKHFEKIYTDMQNFIVNELTETVDALRKEIDTVSHAAKYFAETIPSIEELFTNEPPKEQSGKQLWEISEIQRVSETEIRNEQLYEKTSNPLEEREDLQTETRNEKNIAFKWKGSIASVFGRKSKPADFLEELYKKGYEGEQISYIISCIEEGLNEKEIKRFISPKFDIETMKRLRKLYVKE